LLQRSRGGLAYQAPDARMRLWRPIEMSGRHQSARRANSASGALKSTALPSYYCALVVDKGEQYRPHLFTPVSCSFKAATVQPEQDPEKVLWGLARNEQQPNSGMRNRETTCKHARTRVKTRSVLMCNSGALITRVQGEQRRRSRDLRSTLD